MTWKPAVPLQLENQESVEMVMNGKVRLAIRSVPQRRKSSRSRRNAVAPDRTWPNAPAMLEMMDLRFKCQRRFKSDPLTA